MSTAGRWMAFGLVVLCAAAGADSVDWQGKWIAGEGDGLPLLRKPFTVQEKPVKRAVAYVCGLGQFELYVNGTKVGDHFLDPGWTNYKKTCLYVPLDVTRLLRPGANALGVMLGNGMYNVPGGRYVKFTGSFGKPKLFLQLQVEYKGGDVETICSDESWRSDRSPITFTCIYGGEDYDARLEQPGWATADFDDAKWKGVRVVEGPGGVLREQDYPAVKVAETLKAQSYKKRAPGDYMVTLEYNLSARPYVTVKGKAGQSVTIGVSELPEMPWEGHTYTYTLKGEGEETFRPYFTYFGFQYLFLTGADRPEDASGERPVLLEAGADFVTSSAQVVGAFRCDNALLNDIDDMVTRSVRSNLQHVLTDCPHREKLGWLEVSHLMGPSIAYRYDVSRLYRKICRDTTESQLDNGLVPDIAPEFTRFTGGFFESAEWGSACVQLPWLLYRWYGDQGILEEQFDTMARYTRYLATTRNAEGLAKGGLGDWYDWTPEKGHAGAAQLTPAELTATAMLYDDARLVAKAAALLNNDEAEREFEALAKEVKADFIRAYYHPETHSVSTGSQSALACGLHFGLVPDKDRAAVLDNLVKSVESMQYRPTVGEVCFRFLVRALADGGRSDVMYRILNRTDPPGYGNMLRNFNMKTLSEQWDKPGSSLNHCMFGQVQEWFNGSVLGIGQTEDSTGFRQLRIAPTVVGDLTEASGYFDYALGRVDVHWKRDGGTFTLDLYLPVGSKAEVVLPKEFEKKQSESGQALKESGKFSKVKATDSGTVVKLPYGGEYHFVCEGV